MIIGLRAGHSDNCTGAIGIVDEHMQMKKYYEAVKAVFEKYGHTVIDCNSNAGTQNGELSEGAEKCNSANCDLFISLHMNCYNGSAHGTEVLVSSDASTAYPYAQRLVNNFAELGFYNRGVKFEKLYEMNHIRCGNLISEICFCDSKDDIDIYNKYSWDDLAHVLCNAIDSEIPKYFDEKINASTKKGYIVTTYLPNGNNGDGSFQGVDLNYVLNYFQGIKCYARGNEKGVWIESQYLDMDKCLELKETLGSWFYAIN
ncbi:N-acetylmuramoyl-L-alanine amidase [Clostridium phage HM T]|uniref:N-acetylmuramoyl-L-alanine amidase n=1 Tax=Clostridium saccharoperbutylacetonicum N1-4(HMT) TaxID=931276 RepID=M1LPN3_9CLOT|nr:N-acetylmuramoyl-L-alanine amidase [Clostridium saccharoperbutylacetonicum]AMB17458.1 N-acetylmuramoyl-L-alanine amidase [Clostridium phage HM T]AGF54810.1 N-acetylmuramoyl-L-alanine amidase [Clostridium saccharoperbutylacetonicum N1-4(HMT)]NRT58669.1 N-acetylmuramoyl-L-alanine amidase [Clostridium saccharoperbutylacetonicum]NRT64485.1 N-acetylmuramoyl-L-alanine amidase [Clostridium saccharoperbutylacetonicum]NSB27858.1 N-acetylmuramoyl-L-alanine amidase [Clostridium saccharoperbutylacetoni